MYPYHWGRKRRLEGARVNPAAAAVVVVVVYLQEHSQGALALASYLFHEFCEMLPDASAPLTKLVFHSPHFAYQLASAITSLQPFHVGKLYRGCGSHCMTCYIMLSDSS